MLGSGLSRRGLHAASLLVALALAGCSSLSATAERRLAVFDRYVEVLGEAYPFFVHKHLDWAGLARSYRSAVPQTETPADFYRLLAGLLAELDDPHVSLDVPAANWRVDGVWPTSVLDCDGLALVTVDRALHVAAWPAGAAPVPPAHLPADRSDLPRLERIDGARVTEPLLPVLARGVPGSTAELQLRWDDGTTTLHGLVRPAEPRGRSFTIQVGERVEGEALQSLRERALAAQASVSVRDGIAHLRIASFDADALPAEPEHVKEHLTRLLDEALAADALLLDLTDNPGGQADLAVLVLRRLLADTLEIVQDADERSALLGLVRYREFKSLLLTPEGSRFTGPIVVLVSSRSASAAELVARCLQRTGRARVVGERTVGAEAALVEVPGPDGSKLQFGKRRWRDKNGAGYQGDGVLPHVAVTLRLEDVRRAGSFAAAHRDWHERATAAAVAELRAALGRQPGR